VSGHPHARITHARITHARITHAGITGDAQAPSLASGAPERRYFPARSIMQRW